MVIGIVVGATVVVGFGATLLIRNVPGECTLVGCDSAVTIGLTELAPEVRAEASAVTVCLDGRCDTSPLVADQPWVRSTLAERVVHQATMTITDAAGLDLAHLALDESVAADEFQPNGDRCQPTCWTLRLTARDGALEPAR